MTVSCTSIHRIFGHNFQCSNCSDVCHVPGAFFGPQIENIPDGPKITAGVQIRISQFEEWYYTHPVLKALLRHPDLDTELLQHYGLWGYCAGCHHEYEPSVLKGLPTALESRKYGGSFSFNARSEKSAQDMKALVSGGCLSCANGDLIVILADIPSYVCDTVKEWLTTDDRLIKIERSTSRVFTGTVKRCLNCGAEIPGGALECSSCGSCRFIWE
jgi:hypothetical protein